MAILIKKCANPKCSNIIGTTERPNKKFCSQDCKTKANNSKVKKGLITWEKILERYDELPQDTFIPFPRWLKENYYPPRIIKQKK